MDIIDITLDELLENHEFDIRTYNCLKRAGIETLNELMQIISNEGISYLYEIRNLGRKSAERVLYVLAQYKFDIISLLDTHIEQAKAKNEEWNNWQNIRDNIFKTIQTNKSDDTCNANSILLKDIEGLSNFIYRLEHRYNIKTVNDLLSQFKNEEIDCIGFNGQIKLLRVLDNNGYRFSEISKDKWNNIEDYIMLKRAKHITIKELNLPIEIENILKEHDIDVITLIKNDISLLQEHLTNMEIIKLLQELDKFEIRIKNASREGWENINDFIRYNLRVKLNEIGLSQYILNILTKHDTLTLLQLTCFSRQDLEEMNISKNIVNQIVEVLSNINFHLYGEDFYICNKCNRRFIGQKNETTVCFCEDCQEKLKRINKICSYEVSIEPPDYGSYTNGQKGFTLFVTVHNKSKKPISVKVKEFTVFSNNRQWSPSYSLAGYAFDNEEHIMSQSSKTLGKIWCEDYWQEQRIVNGDYVTFSIMIKTKTYSWKFIMNENKFELDDYYVFN